MLCPRVTRGGGRVATARAAFHVSQTRPHIATLLTDLADVVVEGGGVANSTQALAVARARLPISKANGLCDSGGCGEGCDGGNQKRRRANRCELAHQLAAIHFDHWSWSGPFFLKEIGATKLFQRQVKESVVGRDTEPRGELGRDPLPRPSIFFEQLENTCRRRIEEMNSIDARVIHQHLRVERMTQ